MNKEYEYECETCKHEPKPTDVEPCKSCTNCDKWESWYSDPVSHPAHYADSCSLECIDVMEAVFGSVPVRYFCLCNAFKYMWRYKNKNGQEDLKKAKWYLDRAGSVEDDQLHRMLCLWEKCNGDQT